jgi:cytoskeletal protein RodZ
MKSFKNTFTKKQRFILVIVVIISLALGFWKWRDTFFNTYYPDDNSIQGQLFPNIAHTKIETVENIFSFSGVKYEKVIIRIGSLSSEYDDTNQSSKANNIINRKTLDENFKEWLIQAFDETEAKKISDHIEVYYRGEKIKEIGY